MNKIDDLISRHWKWVRNKIGKDGIKYSKKYSENEHEKFIRKWIDNMGFDDIEMRLIYVMKYNKLLHVV